jgi:hypothetical protein
MTPPPTISPRYVGQDAHQCQTSKAFGFCGPYLPASPPPPPASHDRKASSWNLQPVLGIRIRNRIRRNRMFLGLPDRDQFVRGADPDPAPGPSLFS